MKKYIKPCIEEIAVEGMNLMQTSDDLWAYPGLGDGTGQLSKGNANFEIIDYYDEDYDDIWK